MILNLAIKANDSLFLRAAIACPSSNNFSGYVTGMRILNDV